MGEASGPLRGKDMGRVLQTFRCWPGPISSVVMTVITVGVVAWQWWAVPDDPLSFRFFVLFLMLLLCSAVALPGILERHRVCEHGLVLGYGPTRSARYVVPWASVDPERVCLLRRSQLISRHQGMPQVSPHYRIGTGPLAYRSVAVHGLDTVSSEMQHRRRESRYAWWILGSPQPEKSRGPSRTRWRRTGIPRREGWLPAPWSRRSSCPGLLGPPLCGRARGDHGCPMFSATRHR